MTTAAPTIRPRRSRLHGTRTSALTRGPPRTRPGARPRDPATTRSARRTVAVVLAAGLGTRMQSRTPKVLHQLCGRPMLAYVLDAGARRRRGRAARSSSLAARRRPSATAFDGRGRLRAPGGAARHRRRGARPPLAALPADAAEIVVLSGDVPLVSSRTLLAELLEARRAGRRGDRPRRASTRRAGPPRPGRARRVRAPSSASSRRRTRPTTSSTVNEVNAGLYAFDAALAPPPDRRRSALVGDRRAVPDRPRPDRPRGRPDRRAITFEDDGRLDGHQRPRPAGPGRVGAARPHQRAPHARPA